MKIMLTDAAYVQLADTSVQEVFERVAKLKMSPAGSASLQDGELCSLVVTTHGDYEITLVLSATPSMLYLITEQMKRARPTDDAEVEAYALEFFNILSGHIVSAINRSNRKSARFGIPAFIRGPYPAGQCPNPSWMKEYFYQDCHGAIRLQTVAKAV